MILSYFDFILTIPEIVLFVFTSLILIIGVFLGNKKHNFVPLSTFITLFIIISLIYYLYINDIYGEAFFKFIIIDKLSLFFKFIAVLLTLFTIICGQRYINTNIKSDNRCEFYVLVLFSLLGQMIMISSNNLLSIYLGIELMSLSLYPIIVIQKNNKLALEAAIKYFVLSLFASGIMLYGFSMLYGISSNLNIYDIIKEYRQINYGNDLSKLIGLSFILILVGLLFKLGTAPFHMWIPDVYQGSPTIVSAIISSGPKIAVFAILCRILPIFLEIDNLYTSIILLFISIFSIIIGNIVAIIQNNFKRLLAYSAISNMGFLILPIAQNNQINMGFASFYLISYLISTLLCFSIIMLLSNKNRDFEQIIDFDGLNSSNSILAFYMLFLMLSLAGIPPTLGFYAKLLVFKSLINSGYLLLSIFIAIFSVIGAFYYLNIIKMMYFSKSISNKSLEQNIPHTHNFSISNYILFLGMNIFIFLSIFPKYLLDICINIFN